MTEYSAQYPNEHGMVRRARQAIVEFARTWFSGQGLADIEHAVGEALSNAAEHGHTPGSVVDVRCRCEGERFTVEIDDGGKGFPRWNALDQVRPKSNAPRGYGIFIMKSLMDEVEYRDGGRRLRLMKRLPRASADSGARGSA